MAAGALAYWVGSSVGWPWVLAGAAVLAALGSLVTDRLGLGDAGWIVIDEAAGAFICLIGIVELPAALVALAVFRLADIFKGLAPGVRAAETLPGGVGIMADDVVAAAYGLVVGHLVQIAY